MEKVWQFLSNMSILSIYMLNFVFLPPQNSHLESQLLLLRQPGGFLVPMHKPADNNSCRVTWLGSVSLTGCAETRNTMFFFSLRQCHKPIATITPQETMWKFMSLFLHYDKCEQLRKQISNFLSIVLGKVMVPAVRSWPQIREAGWLDPPWTTHWANFSVLTSAEVTPNGGSVR